MKNYSSIWVSFFSHLKHVNPDSSICLTELFERIRSECWKSEITNCHIDPNNKRTLPCFTPSGIFYPRNTKGIIRYTGVICLDIDHIDNVIAAKEHCKTIPWIWACFISASGSGLKVFVRTNSKQEEFNSIEAEIAVAFYELTGLKRDDKAKDLARLQFISHDPDIYVNHDSIKFNKGSHEAR
jgi:hypothetical protein